jgi:hypothetical protein
MFSVAIYLLFLPDGMVYDVEAGNRVIGMRSASPA